MRINESIAAIEGCESFDQLKSVLQTVIEDHGFSGFNFMDAGNPHLDLPFTDGTSGRSWEQDYQANLFVHVDPCLSQARRTNRPFTWSHVPPPVSRELNGLVPFV